MIVTLLSVEGGILRPTTFNTDFVLVRNDKGTPIMIGATAGEGGGQFIAHCKDANFNKLLQELGVNQTTICDTLELIKPPSGARLVAGPGLTQGG